MIAARGNNFLVAVCTVATFGLGVRTALATTLDVYWTRDPTVAGQRPDPGPGHNEWFQAPTSGQFQNQVLADANSKFWVSFLNDGPKDDPKTMTIEVNTTDATATGPRQHPKDGTGGYDSNDTSAPVPFDWSEYTYGARDEGGTAVKYWSANVDFDDCPLWEVFEFENVNDFPVLFTVSATSTCGCEETRKTTMLLDDASFGTPDGVSAETEIVEIRVFPLLTEIDLAQTPEFSVPTWGSEFVFATRVGEPRPQGGVRFYATGSGLDVGDVYGLSFRTMDRSYGVCEEFAFDAVTESHDRYLHDLASPPWYDPFDLLFEAPGDNLRYHRGWKGWDDGPDLEAPVTDAPVLSPPFAVDIAGPSHAVREFRGEDAPAVYTFSAWTYVPLGYTMSGDGSSLALLSRYEDDGPDDRSMQMNFDSNDGMLKVYYGNGMNTKNTSYEPPDRWIELETRIDLEHDWTQVYYDNELIAEYLWTGGIYGDGTGARDIAAVELFARDSTSIYYDSFLLDRCAPWDEDFTSYAPGSGLHGRIGWKGWDDDPLFDASVADLPAPSPNAAVVQLTTDLVHEHCTAGRGEWSYSTWQYIPAGFTSGGIDPRAGTYFIMLNTYEDGGPYNWSVDMQFDSNDGMLKVYHGNGMNTVDRPYRTDEWIEIEVRVDLESDLTTVYYDGAPIVTYPWTGGAYGAGGGALDIAAVDLYANGSSEVYYDDFRFELAAACPADLDGSGSVDFGDILAILASWGGGGPEDLDGSGIVDFGDILVVLGAWGGACP